jgi:hypothetical protein
MDEQRFDDALERLNRVNAVVEKLDPAIRAAAFNVLAPYIAEPTIGTLMETLDDSSDIAQLAFIVLMEAAESAQEDLKAIMDGVKAINAAKERLRELMRKVEADVDANAEFAGDGDGLIFSGGGLGSEAAYHQAELIRADPRGSGGVLTAVRDLHEGLITSVEQLQLVRYSLRARLDSMNELGEMESLRLQMAMDRMSKLMSTLSNLLKKISDTASAITQNLK